MTAEPRGRKAFRAFKLAWVFNALAALVVWMSLDGAHEIFGRDQSALAIFLAGTTSGALADLSAARMQVKPRGHRPRRAVAGSELLVGLSIVFLVVSVVCLALGLAAAATGFLDLGQV